MFCVLVRLPDGPEQVGPHPGQVPRLPEGQGGTGAQDTGFQALAGVHIGAAVESKFRGECVQIDFTPKPGGNFLGNFFR